MAPKRKDDIEGFVLSDGRGNCVVDRIGDGTSVVEEGGAMVGDCRGDSGGGPLNGLVIRGGSRGVVAMPRSRSRSDCSISACAFSMSIGAGRLILSVLP